MRSRKTMYLRKKNTNQFFNKKQEEEFDFLLKIILVGDSGVGKSCFLSQYTTGKHNIESKTTNGVEFGTKSIQINHKVVKAQIWDTVFKNFSFQ